MSKIKNYDRALYESIEAGLEAMIAPHKFEHLDEVHIPMYFPTAYENAAAFLCLNEIQHTFVTNPINPKLCARIIMVSWIEDDGTESSMAWWERNPSNDCYLVRFEENWADEMDIYGFAIFTAE